MRPRCLRLCLVHGLSAHRLTDVTGACSGEGWPHPHLVFCSDFRPLVVATSYVPRGACFTRCCQISQLWLMLFQVCDTQGFALCGFSWDLRLSFHGVSPY